MPHHGILCKHPLCCKIIFKLFKSNGFGQRVPVRAVELRGGLKATESGWIYWNYVVDVDMDLVYVLILVSPLFSSPYILVILQNESDRKILMFRRAMPLHCIEKQYCVPGERQTEKSKV